MFNSNKYIATYISLNVLSTENIVFGKHVQVGSLLPLQKVRNLNVKREGKLLINSNNLFA